MLNTLSRTIIRNLLLTVHILPMLNISSIITSNILLYYPTLLRRVQIMRETSTNIAQYLYLSHSPDRAKDKKPPEASQNFRETKTLDNKSLIRRFSVQYRCKFLLIICILTRPSGSPKYCMTRKNIQRYYTLKCLIRYIYLPWLLCLIKSFSSINKSWSASNSQNLQ